MRTCIAFALLLCFPHAVFAQLSDVAISALVKITGTSGKEKLEGSGFVVALEADSATIVTAAHVVEGVKSVEVLFASDHSRTFPGDRILGLAAADPNGLAVIQVYGAIPSGVTALPFEISAKPRRGDALYLLGFPVFVFAHRVTQRVLSGRDGNLLLIDPGTWDGFSGGPVIQGEKVVGVISSTTDKTTVAVNALVARDALEGWEIRFDQRSGAVVEEVAQQVRSATAGGGSLSPSPRCGCSRRLGPRSR